MINLPVLVLNQSYEPLNICRVRRAVVLIYQEKAEMVENGMGVIHWVGGEFPIPTVIRLAEMVRRPPRTVRRLTRLEIFKRDNYTCQYCGKETRHLTLDHVMPRFRHGAHTWENVVSACVPCNRHKAGRTPQEAGMRLKHEPVKPRVTGLFYVPAHYPNIRREWQKYLPQSN
ncbi:MAG TPA: HNH endonuclease [Dehalococcoidales bacterium]|nr:HNH endonuclease [Dehalococcoidales bacterium]